ncbi:MAG TPA: ABC transporter permease, partial [Streptosporangiaceae bacterium]|nr:ABC transporter permease [Streptosporangiaceae bacterium]
MSEQAAAAPTPAPEAPAVTDGEQDPRGRGKIILDSIVEGNSVTVTILAIVTAMMIGGLLNAFTNKPVLDAWGKFFSDPWHAINMAWDVAIGAYVGLFQGAIFNPHTVAALFQQSSISTAIHNGYLGAVFGPISETCVQATPLLLVGLAVALPYQAGLFNIGGQSQFIGGAIVATYLGFGVSMPPVIHAIVCVLGGFAGGAAIGWAVGYLKAKTGAHEVIVTIMLNYVMYNFLSYLLGTPTALQLPHQANLISPNIDGNAQLPHVGGPPPQVGVGFLVALAAAAGMWWLLARSTTGFQFRAVGANPSAARTAGMSVGRTWVLAMLLAG